MFKAALFTLLLAASVAARLGGWSAADPKAVEVVQAITLAIHTKYPELSVADIVAAKYKVIDVKQQVVAGMLYDAIIEFTPPGKACEVDHFQVGNRFGEVSLLVSETLTNACTGR